MNNNCTCTASSYKCKNVPSNVTMFVLRSQWLTLSMRTTEDSTTDFLQCIPVLIHYLDALSNMFLYSLSLFGSDECIVLGCVKMPLLIISNHSDWLPSRGRICDPVHYGNEKLLTSSTSGVKYYRQAWNRFNLPFKKIPHMIIRCEHRSDFFVLGDDLLFHLIPNFILYSIQFLHSLQRKQIVLVSDDHCEEMLVFGEVFTSYWYHNNNLNIVGRNLWGIKMIPWMFFNWSRLYVCLQWCDLDDLHNHPYMYVYIFLKYREYSSCSVYQSSL